jgi:cysteine desulfurase
LIYLDNAATTKIGSEVLQAMMPYLYDEYGNPGTLYPLGQRAHQAVEQARVQVASLIHADADQVYFTSGGSEANTTAFHGIKKHLARAHKNHIIVSQTEHNSVLSAARSLKDYGFDDSGFEVEFLPVSENGTVSPTAVENAIRPETGLVSVMYVNNETGCVNSVDEIGSICAKHGVLFHTDCVQAAGCHEIDVAHIGCDLLSLSSHKIHGPKGVGALFVKHRSLFFPPVIFGGSNQEFGLRGGTENVAGIVGFGRACELALVGLEENRYLVSFMKQQFYTEFMGCLQEDNLENCVHINGSTLLAPGKVLNLRLDGVDGETLLLMLGTFNVCVSAGSACNSHDVEPSHVLTAMGLSNEEARSSIRVSFSRLNTGDEVREAAQIMAHCVKVLKGREPQ